MLFLLAEHSRVRVWISYAPHTSISDRLTTSLHQHKIMSCNMRSLPPCWTRYVQHRKTSSALNDMSRFLSVWRFNESEGKKHFLIFLVTSRSGVWRCLLMDGIEHEQHPKEYGCILVLDHEMLKGKAQCSSYDLIRAFEATRIGLRRSIPRRLPIRPDHKPAWPSFKLNRLPSSAVGARTGACPISATAKGSTQRETAKSIYR